MLNPVLTEYQDPIDSYFGALELNGRSCVIVAVSGGSDSLGLLVLLKSYCEHLPEPPRIVAVTVDHKLRMASGLESLSVASRCKALNVEHRTVVWCDPKPTTGIMAAARMARYELLSSVSDELGADMVLTGHTLDDQAETVTMRAERAKTGRGTAGIAPATLFQGKTWFVRPLLAVSRETLRMILTEQGINWVDDPSNGNPVFERVRVRHAGAQLDRKALHDAWIERVKLAHAGAEFISDDNVLVGDEEAHMPLNMQEHPGFDSGVGVLMAYVSKAEHFPPDRALYKVSALMMTGKTNEKLTVHGCLLIRQRDRIVIESESRNTSDGPFRFDLLMPLDELPLAAALWEKIGRLSPLDSPFCATDTSNLPYFRV